MKPSNDHASPIKKRSGGLISNSLLLGASDLGWKMAMLYWVLVVGRTFGQEGLGSAELALSLGAVLHLTTNLGLSTHLLKNLAEKPEQLGKAVSGALSLKLIACLLFYGGAFLFVARRFDGSVPTLTCILVGCLGFSLAEFGFYFSRALSQFKVESQSRGLTALFLVVMVSFGWWLEVSLQTFAIYLAVAPALYFLLSARNLKVLNRASLSWLPGIPSIRLLRGSISYGLTDLMGLLYLKVDVFLLGALVGMAELGVYSVPSRIILGFLFIPTVVSSVLLPMAGRDHFKDPGATVKKVGQAAAGLLWIAASIGAVAFFFSTELISTLLGPEFIDSAPVLSILAFYLLFRFVNFPMSTLLVVANRQGDRIKLTMLSLALNIGLNLWLIPILGAVGAASATVLSEMALTVGFYRSCSKVTPNMAAFVRPLLLPLATIAILAGIFMTSSPLFVGILMALPPGVLLLLFGITRLPFMSRKKKTLLLLRFSPGNRGDDVILESLVRQARSRATDEKLLIFTRRPEDAPDLRETYFEFRGAHPPSLLTLFRALATSKALLLAGGTNLRECDPDKENYRPSKSLGSLPTGLVLVLMARIANTPVGLVGQGFREARQPVSKFLLRRILGLSSFVSVRDKTSLGLAKNWGKTGVILGADLAFSHSGLHRLKNQAFCTKGDPEGHEQEKSIGVSYRYALHGEERERYAESFALGLIGGVERTDELRFLTFSTQPDNPLEDDGVAKADLVRRFPENLDARMIFRDDWNDSSDLSRELASLSFLIATRLHACILGLLQETPVLGIAYDEKVEDLFREMGLSEYCLHPQQILDHPSHFAEKIRELSSQCGSPVLKSRIREGLDVQEQRSRSEMQELHRWLDQVGWGRSPQEDKLSIVPSKSETMESKEEPHAHSV